MPSFPVLCHTVLFSYSTVVRCNKLEVWDVFCVFRRPLTYRHLLESESRTKDYSVRGNLPLSLAVIQELWTFHEQSIKVSRAHLQQTGVSYIRGAFTVTDRWWREMLKWWKESERVMEGRCCEWFFGSVLAGCCVEWERSNQQVYCRRNSSPWEAHLSDPAHALSCPPALRAWRETRKENLSLYILPGFSSHSFF